MTADMKAPTVSFEDVETLVRALSDLLHGQEPALQSVALADLLATFLAGHYVPGNQAETIKVREQILERHLRLVRTLIPINARSIHRGDQ